MPTVIEKYSNPVAMLKSDHGYVKQVMDMCLNAEAASARTVLVQEIADNLNIHATLEEEIFYPALEEFGGEEGQRFVRRAIEDHRRIKAFAEDLQSADPTGSDFRVTLGRLQSEVLSHAEAEEQIFPLAEERLPIGELARRMDLRRLQLVARFRPPSGLVLISLVLIGAGLLFFLSRRRKD